MKTLKHLKCCDAEKFFEVNVIPTVIFSENKVTSLRKTEAIFAAGLSEQRSAKQDCCTQICKGTRTVASIVCVGSRHVNASTQQNHLLFKVISSSLLRLLSKSYLARASAASPLHSLLHTSKGWTPGPSEASARCCRRLPARRPSHLFPPSPFHLWPARCSDRSAAITRRRRYLTSKQASHFDDSDRV